MYLATLDRCDAEKLIHHPIVQGVDVNVAGNFHEKPVAGPGARRRHAARQGDAAAAYVNQSSNSQSPGSSHRLSKRRVPDTASRFKMQQPSPDHLRWITGLRFTHDPPGGNFRDVDNFAWDEPLVGDDGIPPPFVYVVDYYFNQDIPEYEARVVDSWRINDDGDTQRPLAPPPNDITAFLRDHGTCMASLAAGSYYGVAKNANLVLVQMGETVWTAMQALLTVVIDIRQQQAQSRAVVSMSWGEQLLVSHT